MIRLARTTLTSAVLSAAAAMISTAAIADQPGAGLTSQFEVEFMQRTVDHHFAALRMTELAAGTDPTRDAGIQGQEGTSPTWGFSPSQAKATDDEIKSIARRNNRMQREEMMTLKRFLRSWYNIEYEPKLTGQSQAMINLLEQAQPGADFNHKFLEVFSRHHFSLMNPVNGCMTGSELQHHDLRRECRNMWHAQISDIEMMREKLKKQFNIADYQPFQGSEPLQGNAGAPRGQHSGAD